MIEISDKDFVLWTELIEQICAIKLPENKKYLIQSRLTPLMVENGFDDYFEFYTNLKEKDDKYLELKIINAMTTNETLWFRDTHPFRILSDVLLPQYVSELKTGKRKKINIWCAASSTGQEPYSIAMIISDYMRKDLFLKPEHFCIRATDISSAALFVAKLARYDNIAISRGLPAEYKERYFEHRGFFWQLSDEIKSMIEFSRFNLQDEFDEFAGQDIIFCRNVLIYFSEEFKKDVVDRFTKLFNSKGILFVGASESLLSISDQYDVCSADSGIYYSYDHQGGN